MTTTIDTERRGTALRQPGAILLISCYELGHQPLTLAAPLARLRDAGYTPAVVDTAVESLDDAAIAAARFVAISVPMHTAMRLGTQIAARIRASNPTAHICFYGLYAVLNADYLLAEAGDSVLGGEYLEPMLDTIGRLERGEAVSPRPETASAPAAAHLAPLTPAREELPPLRSYAGLELNRVIVPAGYVEATRGCHHTCRHCPITPVYHGRLVVVPREQVLADIRTQVRAGARHITFGDPDFLNGPGHSLRICQAMHEEFPAVTFDATTKIEHILQHRRVLPQLAELGCAFILSAVESLNDNVLTQLKKGHTRADVFTALALLDEAGIPLRPSLLPFTPWETLDSYVDLLTFIAEQDLFGQVDPVHLSIRLLIPPESAVLTETDTSGWLGELDSALFTYRWRHPDPRMDTLQREVAAIAEAAAANDEPPRDTFGRIWEATFSALDQTPPPIPAPRVHRGPTPHLTESWFCCAEPTANQMAPLISLDSLRKSPVRTAAPPND